MKNPVAFLLTALALALIAISHCAAFSGNGSGTVGDPYQITNVDELQEMNTDDEHRSAHYILMNNIDASATSTWNWYDDHYEGFDPIGRYHPSFILWSFTGSLDGGSHVISGLYINRSSILGFFGYIGLGGSVESVGLEDADITGNSTVGGFCGMNDGAISDCYFTGSVTGYSAVGGFCGFNNDGAISGCYFTGSVTGSGSGNNAIAGFCAYNDYKISDCYSTGSVTGDDYVGGFCAHNRYSGISDCYSTGSVTGNTNVGGFCAANGNNISNCFWDTQTSGQSASDGGTGKTTAEMKTQSTFTGAGWDFTDTWYMCDNVYPQLQCIPKRSDVWVSASYCCSCSNDGHIWSTEAFDNLDEALCKLADGGTLHLAEDWTITGDLTLADGKKYALGDYDLFVSGHILGADKDHYIVTDGDGRLIMTTASSQTWSLGTANLGLCPLVITAPASNTFGVNLKDYTDESICRNFFSQCYWDIEHTAGSDDAQIDFVYQKANVPSALDDPTTLCYILHNEGGNSWRNITPGGATTVDNWNGDADFYMTHVANVSDFSPFAPSAFASIPTLSEWTAIALGGLLLIFGGWVIWRRAS